MGEVVYRSQVKVERIQGPLRRAYLPGGKGPVMFGVHGAIAEHYKVPADLYEPHTTTIDYVVSAAAG